MNLAIYKQGQGHWTRLMTFLGGMIMFAWGAAWLAGQISKIDFPKGPDGVSHVVDPQYIQFGAGITLLVTGAALCYWIAYNKPRTVEFFIATEGEMKKVNWSSRREVFGSTWVVVGISVMLAACLFVVDLGFSRFFQMIGILNPAR